MSSDIELFTVSLPNSLITTPLVGQLCAVLTNSDASLSDPLYVSQEGGLY